MVPPVITHYKVLEKLGEGGMGVVHKAQDTKLDRFVALKFLPPHVASSGEDKARFLQEAKAAAALNHNNICTIYGVDEADGTMFIAMEFIEGGTLREKIPFARVEDALGVATQIGDALQEAHAKGIVHRDIKADNVMLTSRGQAKVMDFGLAKLRGSLKLTKTSSTLGTIGYMAPEQIQGGEVDNRSDIFSFGVLLFEMLTGRLPFRGEHEAAMMYSILNEEPSDVRALRPDAPEDVDRIIRRSLEKDPADRYQHVDDMVSELRRAQKQTSRVTRPQIPQQTPVPPAGEPVQASSKRKMWIGIAGGVLLALVAAALLYRVLPAPGGGPVTSRKMLVVLPFENLGGSDQEYFADGITEEITSKLSGLSGLGVIARSSAMQYKKSAKSLKQIGQELNVAYVLQGTIRWESSGGVTNVRVTPQLVNVGDGTQVWSEPFEAVLAGSFKLQTEIAANVARALDVALLQPERRSLETSPTTNPEAYDSYLRGLSYYHRSYAERDLKAAELLFAKAVQLDQNFASAHAWLSAVRSTIYWEYYDHTEERVVKAKEAAETSLRLDPALAIAHVAMGSYYYHGRLDYDNALKEFEQALALQPSNVEALISIAAVKRRQGKFEEAAVIFARGVEMDPRAGLWPAELSITYSLMRRFPEAERYADRAIALSPDWSEAYVFKARAYLGWDGNTSKARAVLEDATSRKVGAQDPHFINVAVTVDILDGRWGNALDRLSRVDLKALDVQEYFLPVDLLKAEVLGHLKRRKDELLAYDSARIMLEHLAALHPEDSRFHASLGLAYAGLGRKEEALREGRLAVEQLPIAREALRGSYRAGDLAEIYAMTGEQDAALALLEQLLSIPSPYSAPVLRIDPAWEGLRANPRFQRLIDGKDHQ